MTNDELLELIKFDELLLNLNESFLNIQEINNKIPEIEDVEEIEDIESLDEIELLNLENEEITDTEILIDALTQQNLLLESIDTKLFEEEEKELFFNQTIESAQNAKFSNLIFILYFMFIIARFIFSTFTRYI